MDYVIHSPVRVEAAVALPGSKSIAARTLLIRALTRQPGRLSGVPACDDTLAMQRGLEVRSGTVDVGMAGTALRFLTAFHACRPGHEVTLDGSERLRERPVGELVQALRALGAHIDCPGRADALPMVIHGTRLHGGRVALRGDVSSQFVSALMMAPVVGGLEITLEGNVVSAPYIDMTRSVMRHHGIEALWQGNVISIPAGEYYTADLDIEADWSAAAYWLSLQALLPDSRITLLGLRPDSWQGDSRLLTLMEQMGMTAHWLPGDALRLDMSRTAQCCCSTFADLTGTPDVAPPLIVTLCLLGRPFRITGLRTLRHKESDRREALRTELCKLGYVLQIEGDDAVAWHFETCRPEPAPHLDAHGDHRIAMAMALAATRHPGIVVCDAGVVAKSYPAFWEHLHQVGFTVETAG